MNVNDYLAANGAPVHIHYCQPSGNRGHALSIRTEAKKSKSLGLDNADFRERYQEAITLLMQARGITDGRIVDALRKSMPAFLASYGIELVPVVHLRAVVVSGTDTEARAA